MGKIFIFITKQTSKQQIKHWSKRFLKEMKATYKNNNESRLKQQQAILLEKSFESVMLSARGCSIL